MIPKELTDNQSKVCAYLASRDYVSPTEIGRGVMGPGYHSSWASPICKKLVSLGFLERSVKGAYRLLPIGERK